MIEVWKDIVGYEDLYEVSNFGRIRRKFRKDIILSKLGNPYEKVYQEQIMKFKYIRGHCNVTLVCKDKNKKTLQVHRIVLKTFNPVNDMETLTVNHKNGIKDDNNIINLEWATYKEQTEHAIKTGLRKEKEQNGELNKMAKLTWEQVKEIRRLGRYDNYQKIAKKYNVSSTLIGQILRNEIWIEN